MELWRYLDLFVMGELEPSLIGYLIFGLISAFFGLLTIFLDWAFCMITKKEKSLIGITYKYPSRFPLLLGAYVVGAGIVGLLGSIMSILNFHLLGAVSAGVGWLAIAPQIVASRETGEEEVVGEEEEKEEEE